MRWERAHFGYLEQQPLFAVRWFGKVHNLPREGEDLSWSLAKTNPESQVGAQVKG